MIDADKLRKDPTAFARFMTFMEYDRPQIVRSLIEDCGVTPSEAQRLATQAQDEYDRSPEEEEDEPSRPLGEIALEEQDQGYRQAVAAEHDLTQSNRR